MMRDLDFLTTLADSAEHLARTLLQLTNADRWHGTLPRVTNVVTIIAEGWHPGQTGCQRGDRARARDPSGVAAKLKISRCLRRGPLRTRIRAHVVGERASSSVGERGGERDEGEARVPGNRRAVHARGVGADQG